MVLAFNKFIARTCATTNTDTNLQLSLFLFLYYFCSACKSDMKVNFRLTRDFAYALNMHVKQQNKRAKKRIGFRCTYFKPSE